ncbi:MAG TPA: hypothetical protein VE442_09645 [Jatrophihabitans sp.]|jgi:hypothetical protein|nr:hypothetical protein [Jatrophihabitans sp.]
MNKPALVGVATLAGTASALLIDACVAQAAPGGLQEQPLSCDNGQQITVLTNVNNSSDMGGWGAVQVVSGGSGTLIPTTFDFSAFDDTIQAAIFDGTEVKGGSHGNHNRPTVTCSDLQPATLGDLLGPSDEAPPGASLTDHVTITITATAVWEK